MPAVEQLLQQPRPPARPSASISTSPSAASAATSATSASTPTRNAGEIKAYLDAAIKEFENYAKMPYLAGRKPHFVYFGGGTPSYLSVPQLQDLTDRMKDIMPWDEAEEVAVRVRAGDPQREETRKHPRARRDPPQPRRREFRRPHPRVETAARNRSKEIERAYLFAKSLGFPQINIDLIAGMMDEAEDNWKRCVEKAIELDPECVTIYQMEVPYNTTIYKQMKEDGKLTAPVADWQTKRRWVDYALRRIREGRLHRVQRLHRGEEPGHNQVRLPRRALGGRRPAAAGRRLIRPARRHPPAEPGGRRPLHDGHRQGREPDLPRPCHHAGGARHPRVHPAAQARQDQHQLLRGQVRLWMC